MAGWVERYLGSHPDTLLSAVDGGVLLRAGTGSSAVLQPLLPFEPPDVVEGPLLIPALAEHALRPLVTALLLVRRGGYAVGVAVGSELAHSKVGSRYVQSRTAAGGWSQQRFARRRAGQTQQLVRAAAQAWSDLPPGAVPAIVVTGGDRQLCEQLLAEPALGGLRGLGVARHLDVPDPRLDVLRAAAGRAQAIDVTVREP